MRKILFGILCTLTFGFPLSCRKGSASPDSKPTSMPTDARPQPTPAPDKAVKSPPMERVRPVITKNGIGEVRLGMNLADLKKLFPLAEFKRQEDGDGATWFIFTTQVGDTMYLYVGDLDTAASDMWNRGIETIQIYSTLYATEDGVRVGDLISDTEEKIGKAIRISESEIESRQFIEFERQPVGIGFRIDDSGIFPEGSRITEKYQEAGKIHAITASIYH